MDNSGNAFVVANSPQSFLAKAILRPLNQVNPVAPRARWFRTEDAYNNEVARVHQYLRPDGTIGGSGRPDPKKVLYLYQGILYLIAH
jgi:hypothetical protein